MRGPPFEIQGRHPITVESLHHYDHMDITIVQKRFDAQNFLFIDVMQLQKDEKLNEIK